MKNQLPPAQELLAMFRQINRDCAKKGETVVSLTDVDYYAQQIDNIYEGYWDEAVERAKQMAKLAKAETPERFKSGHGVQKLGTHNQGNITFVNAKYVRVLWFYSVDGEKLKRPFRTKEQPDQLQYMPELNML